MRFQKSSLLHVTMFFVSFLAFPFGDTAAQTTNIPGRITQAVDERNLVVLQGNVHPLARPEFDQGVVADAQPLNRILLLLQRSPGQETALRQLLDEQQSKSSPNFHAWLTPEQFGKQFGPADADIQAVTQWLTSQGFTDIKVGPGRTVIEFSGNVAQVRNAFHTQIRTYVVNGETHMANATDPQIPAALTSVVAGTVSLNNFPVKSYIHPLGTFQKSRTTGRVWPLFTFPGPCQSGNCYALGPADFATIYNTAPLLNGNPKIDGTGQTIAIVGESNIKVHDVVDFRTMFGLPQNFSSSNVILNGPDPGINGSEGESDLDIQWSGAVAPGATIDFVTSASTETTAGIFLSGVYIVDNNLAGVMSESFGGCEQRIGTLNQFHNSLWEQAVAQGITVMLSSGDGGSAGCDNFNTQQTASRGLGVSGFASTPFNVAVGGTDFDQAGKEAQYWNTAPTTITPPVPSSALSYISEVPWNDSCAQNGLNGCASGNLLNIVAGSGGASTLYSKPTWQMGVTGVPQDNHRDLPDVSLFASNGFNASFYIMCESDVSPLGSCNLTNFGFSFQGVGGTSVSSPAFAGIMALVNQKQATAQNPAPRQGNANYVLYALAKKPGASCDSNGTTPPAATCTFNDVTKGNIAVPCAGNSPNCSSKVSGVNGVLVEPSSSTTPAYPATAGYDLATGLGSVNAQNLVNNWSSVSFLGTKTTLTLNNNSTASIAHGASVPITIAVAPSLGTGTPKGDVSLIGTLSNGRTLGLGDFTLGANGTVTGATTSLAGGTYTISAHYTGDGTFAPSDSSSVNLTVTPEASKVFVTVPTFDPNTGRETGNTPTTLVYGSPYILRVDVTNAQGSLNALCAPPNCPTGTVVVTDTVGGVSQGAPNSGTFVLNSSGYTEDLPVQFPGGNNVITVAYSGDPSFALPAQPTTYTLNVTPAPTQMSVPYIPYSPEIVGTPVSVSAFLTTNLLAGAAPTGTITFFDGGTLIPGPVTLVSRAGGSSLDASISGSMMAKFTTSGTHSITAQYSGDASYAAATSSPWDATVLWPTAMTQSVNSTIVTLGQSVTITAKVSASSQGPPMTGQFQFYGSYTAIPSPVTPTLNTDGNGNQILTATVTTIPQGSEMIQVSYPGDSNYQGASTQNFITVIVPDFSVHLNPGTLTLPAGQSGTTVVAVAPADNSASTVALACVTGVTIPGITCNVNPPTVTLANGASATASVTISTLGPTTGAPLASMSVAVPPTRIPRNKAAKMPWVLLLLPACASGMALLSSFGRRHRWMLIASCAGCLTLVVVGCGGGSGAGGGGGGGSGPVPTTIGVASSGIKLPALSSVTFTATVTSSRSLTGTVQFFENGFNFSGAVPLVNGQAQVTTTNFSTGIYKITAQYSGDTNNLASQTTGIQQVMTGSVVWTIAGTDSTIQHADSLLINLQ